MAINKVLKTLSPQPTLSSAVTAQQITTSTLEVRSVIIYAADTNTGAVYIGTSNASSKYGTGVSLSPGNGYEIEGDYINGTPEMISLSSIYFDGETTGNKLVVQYLYEL